MPPLAVGTHNQTIQQDPAAHWLLLLTSSPPSNFNTDLPLPLGLNSYTYLWGPASKPFVTEGKDGLVLWEQFRILRDFEDKNRPIIGTLNFVLSLFLDHWYYSFPLGGEDFTFSSAQLYAESKPGVRCSLNIWYHSVWILSLPMARYSCYFLN